MRVLIKSMLFGLLISAPMLSNAGNYQHSGHELLGKHFSLPMFEGDHIRNVPQQLPQATSLKHRIHAVFNYNPNILAQYKIPVHVQDRGHDRNGVRKVLVVINFKHSNVPWKYRSGVAILAFQNVVKTMPRTFKLRFRVIGQPHHSPIPSNTRYPYTRSGQLTRQIMRLQF